MFFKIKRRRKMSDKNKNLKYIFSNEGKDDILRRMAEKLKVPYVTDLSEKTSEKFGIIKIIISIIITLLFMIMLGYVVIFNNIQNFTTSATSGFHWMYGLGAGVVSFLIAIAFTRYIYVSIFKFVFWKPSTKDFVIISLCVLLTILSAYTNRNKFFAKDAGLKEICPALIVGDMPTIKNLNQGVEEGLNCIPLTKKEAALALSIDRLKTPNEIKFKNFAELDALEPFINGAVAIYIGEAKESRNKIYDGPGFNPRKLGILRPITEDELIAYKKIEREERNKLIEERNLKKEKLEKEANLQKQKTEAEEKIKAESDKKENERIDAENRKKAEVDIARGIFRQKFVDDNTKKILLSSLNIKSYTVPDNYEVIQKTGGVTQKGNIIEVRNCFICKDDFIIIRPNNHHPIPYPSDSNLYKDVSKKSKTLQEAPSKQDDTKPLPWTKPDSNQSNSANAFNIEFLGRDPSKETFTFSSGSKLEGNKVSSAGPIRIVSVSCLKIFISVDDLPAQQVCDGRTWTVQSGQVWKIVNSENYSIYSKNVKVSSFN